MKKKILLIVTFISFLFDADNTVLISNNDDANIVYEIVSDEQLFQLLNRILNLIKNHKITSAAMLLNEIDSNNNVFLQVKNSRCQKLMQQIKLALHNHTFQFKKIIKFYMYHAQILKKINNLQKLENNKKDTLHHLQLALKNAKLIQAYSYIFSIVFKDNIVVNKDSGQVLLSKNFF